jgi:hypothetical protein
MDMWMHQIIALERRERWRQAAAGARTDDSVRARHPEACAAERQSARGALAERRATWADRRARRKRKLGVNPQDAADIAGAAQARGGFFTTKSASRP